MSPSLLVPQTLENGERLLFLDLLILWGNATLSSLEKIPLGPWAAGNLPKRKFTLSRSGFQPWQSEIERHLSQFSFPGQCLELWPSPSRLTASVCLIHPHCLLSLLLGEKQFSFLDGIFFSPTIKYWCANRPFQTSPVSPPYPALTATPPSTLQWVLRTQQWVIDPAWTKDPFQVSFRSQGLSQSFWNSG